MPMQIVTLTLQVWTPDHAGVGRVTNAINAALNEPPCYWGDWVVGEATATATMCTCNIGGSAGCPTHDEAVNPPAAPSPAAPATVFVAHHENKYGAVYSAYATLDAAEAERLRVAAEGWPDLMGEDPPSDPEEMADTYFEHASERRGEWFTIEECELVR